MRIYSSTITGSLKVKGDVHAENYIVQSTVTQVTRSFASGSSIFGDDVLDTHQFTGSILSSGSANFDGSLMVTSSALTVDVDGGVSGSSASTGSFGRVNLATSAFIEKTGSIRRLDVKRIAPHADDLEDYPGNLIRFDESLVVQGSTNLNLQIDDTGGGKIVIDSDGVTAKRRFTVESHVNSQDEYFKVASGSDTLSGAGVSISGSAISTGSFGAVTIGTGAKSTIYGLTIQDDSTAGIVLNDTGQGGPYQIAANGSVFYIRYNGDNTKSIFLKNDGTVGIGAASPSKKLQVDFTSVDSGFRLNNTGTSGTHKNEIEFNLSPTVDTSYTHGTVGYHAGDSWDDTKFVQEILNGGVTQTIAENHRGNTWRWYTGGVERLVITSTGNISGSSTSTGSFSKLIIEGDSISTYRTDFTTGGSTPAHFFGRNTSNDAFPIATFNHAGGASFFIGKSKISGSINTTGSFGRGNFMSRVGIGTTNPDTNLHISKTSTDVGLRLTAVATSDARIADISFFNDTDSVGAIQAWRDGADDQMSMRFLTQGSDGNLERLRITHDAKISGSAISTGSFARGHFHSIGINDTAPDYALDVTAGGADTEMVAAFRGAQGGTLFIENTATDEVCFRVGSGDFITFNEGSSERMRIDGNGKVGIGTDNPQKLLHLHQANSNTLFEAVNIRTNSAGEGLALGVNADNSSYVVNSDSSNALHLGGSSSTINGTGHLTVDGGGKIGIGTASPSANLTISGSGASTNNELSIESDVYPILRFKSYGDSANNREFRFASVYNTYGKFEILSATNNTAAATTTRLSISGVTGDIEFPTAYAKISGSSTSTGSFGAGFFGGNVGVGIDPVVTDFDRVLHIAGTNTAITRFTATNYGNTSSDGGYVGLNFGGIELWQKENNYMRFGTNNTERMRIDSSGRVSIGHSSTTQDLEVFNTANDSEAKLTVTAQSSGGNTSTLRLRANRNDTKGSNTIVTNGQFVGQILFQGADGSDYANAARIYATVDGAPGSNDMPGAINFGTSADGSEGLTHRMIIDSSGDVGIGTASPVGKLDIVGDQTLHLTNTTSDDTNKNPVITSYQYDSGTETEGFMMMQGFSNSSLNRVDIGGGNSQHNATEVIRFFTAANATTATGTERMQIDNSGNVGIGTSSPGQKLTLQGGNMEITGSGGQGIFFTGTSDGSNKNALYFRTQGGTEKFRFIHDASADNTNDFQIKSNASSNMVVRMLQNGDFMLGNTVINPASGFSNQKGFGYDFSTGEVQIATTANAQALTIGKNQGTAGALVVFRHESTAVGQIDTAGGISGSSSSTGSFGELHIPGKIGVAKTNPEYQIDVAGSVNISDDLIVGDELRPYEIRPSGTSGVRLANSQGNIVGTFGPRSTGANASGIRIEDDFNLILGSDNDYSIAYNATSDNLVISNGVDFSSQQIQLDPSGLVGINTGSMSAMLEIVGHSSKSSTSLIAHGEVKFRTTSNDASELRHQFSMGGSGDPGSYNIYQADASTIGVHLDAGDVSYFNGGNVGIGISSPVKALHVVGETRFVLGGSARVDFDTVGGDSHMAMTDSDGATKINLDTEGDNYLNGGNLGIGTTSPDGVLHVSGALGDAYFEGYSTSGRFAGIQFLNTANSNGDTVAAVNVDRDGADDAGALTFDTQPAGSGMTEAMRITSTQRVGIGTTDPGGIVGEAMLDVSETGTNSDARIVSRTNDVTGSFGAAQGGSRFFSSGAGLAIMTNSNHPIQFGTNVTAGSATEDVIIDTNGRVGIGETAPDGKLHVRGDSGAGVAANAAADEIIAEGQNGGISILALDAGDASLIFGSTSDNVGAQAKWNYDANVLRFRTSKSGAKMVFGGGDSDNVLTVNSSSVGIGTESPSFPLTVSKNTSDPVAFFGFSQVNAEDKHGLIVIQSGTIPQSGGDLSGEAGIIFRHSGGTGGVNFDGNAGSIKSLKMDTYAATGQAHNRLVFSTTFNNTDGERMTILDSGNVGIGVTSPTQKLDVRGGLNSVHAIFSGQDSRGLLIETQATTNNDDTVVLNAQTSTGEIAFETNSTERMRIDSSGKISGSSTSTGSFGNLYVRGNSSIFGAENGIGIGSGYTVMFNLFNGRDMSFRGTGNDRELGITTSTSSAIKFFFKHQNGTADGATGLGIGQVPADNVELDVYGDIEYTGTITDVSLRSIKENIVQITGSEAGMIDKFKQLPLYKYNLKPDAMNVIPTPANNFTTSSIRQHPKYVKNSPKYGLIADDAALENAIPELVQWRMEGEASGSINTSKIGIDTTSYIGVLHGVIKELVTKVETLETQMAQVSGSS